MSTGDNTALVRRLYAEVMGKGNMAEADQLLSIQYVEHVPVLTSESEGLKQLVMMEWREMHIYRVVGGKIVVSKCPV